LIPQSSITAWREFAPWLDDAQIEQDLVLSRATVELFRDEFLKGKIALRGGTALQKLLINPPYRYSDDIDLVQTEQGPIGRILDAIRANLDPWLGKPVRDRSAGTVTLNYRFESEVEPIRPLRLKIEINSREHFALLGKQEYKFSVENPWFSGDCNVMSFSANELLATKLRALYQRRKGRDLFDLWLCLDKDLIEPEQVVRCFLEYVQRAGNSISRGQFESNLTKKEADQTFLTDIKPLLRPGLDYDPVSAIKIVRHRLIETLPGDPWRGQQT
jgi:predicted nucleotidyltransferase component of viral defense system